MWWRTSPHQTSPSSRPAHRAWWRHPPELETRADGRGRPAPRAASTRSADARSHTRPLGPIASASRRRRARRRSRRRGRASPGKWRSAMRCALRLLEEVHALQRLRERLGLGLGHESWPGPRRAACTLASVRPASSAGQRRSSTILRNSSRTGRTVSRGRRRAGRHGHLVRPGPAGANIDAGSSASTPRPLRAAFARHQRPRSEAPRTPCGGSRYERSARGGCRRESRERRYARRLPHPAMARGPSASGAGGNATDPVKELGVTSIAQRVAVDEGSSSRGTPLRR